MMFPQEFNHQAFPVRNARYGQLDFSDPFRHPRAP